MTILSAPDQKTFYKLFYAAGDYVNALTKAVPEVKKMNPRSYQCSYNEALKIVAEMRAHPELMEQMAMDSKQKLTEDERQIIASWARMKPGDYAVMEHTSNGSIFISEQDDAVYRVIGLRKSLGLLIPQQPPVRATTCLMPFRNCIITDGFIDFYRTGFTSERKARLSEIYTSAVTNHAIQTSL